MAQGKAAAAAALGNHDSTPTSLFFPIGFAPIRGKPDWKKERRSFFVAYPGRHSFRRRSNSSTGSNQRPELCTQGSKAVQPPWKYPQMIRSSVPNLPLCDERRGVPFKMAISRKVLFHLFQANFFAFPVEGGLINSQNLGRLGEVGSSFEDLANVCFLELLHGNQRTNLQHGAV
jgi:hypothetical protein